MAGWAGQPEVPRIVRPLRSGREDRRTLARPARGHHARLLRCEIFGAERLGVREGRRERVTPAQRTVGDEQVVIVHSGLTNLPRTHQLQRELRRLDRFREVLVLGAVRGPGKVDPGRHTDRGGVGRGREQAPPDLVVDDLGDLAAKIAADHTGGVRGGDRGVGVALAVLGSQVGVDATDAVDEQYDGGRADVGTGRQRAPRLHRKLDVQLQLGRALRRRPGAGAGPVEMVRGAEARVPRFDEVPHSPTLSMRADRASLRTSYRTGIRSANAGTWVTTPTIRSPRAARFSSVAATMSRVATSRVPKPSSSTIDSRLAAPVDIPASCSDSASASDSEAWNVSPPDRVRTARRSAAS